MTSLIGIDGKYYRLKDDCEICKKIAEEPPGKWSFCINCGHLFYIDNECKCNHEINFYSRKEEYGFLSNFWRCPQHVGENIPGNPDSYYIYSTNEHYYQSQKAKDDSIREWISKSPTPYAAMMAGRNLRPQEIVEKWDEIKVNVMLKGLRAKFENPELKQRLLDTGDAILHEDSPVDHYWGKLGKDMLGKLLMQVRDEIKQQEG